MIPVLALIATVALLVLLISHYRHQSEAECLSAEITRFRIQNDGLARDLEKSRDQLKNLQLQSDGLLADNGRLVLKVRSLQALQDSLVWPKPKREKKNSKKRAPRG